jgi:hypothetical protein
MSDIPFVNLLGDELERAAERALDRPVRSRRRRRLGLLAVAGALLASGSALAAGLLTGDAEQQASAAIACYDGADPDFSGSVAVVPPEAGSADVSPVELCRRALGPLHRETALVACGTSDGVVVIPGRDPSDCRAAGLAPLAADFGPARTRVARLERRILAIEASADCIPRDELVRRVQRLLDRSGWTGWTARPHRLGMGPCGSVSGLGGDGRRYITHGLDAAGRRVLVGRAGHRRITDLLYSADRSLLLPLFSETGARCFTIEGLGERARQLFGAQRVRVAVRSAAIPRATALDDSDGRWTRYQAGCAVLGGGEPGDDGDSVTIEVLVQR